MINIHIQYSEFRAHSVFQGKRKFLKNLECKKYMVKNNGTKYFNTVKNFRTNSVFRASESCWTILNDKKYFNTVNNFRATLLFKVSASCSKILNVQNIFSTVKNFRVNCVFLGKGKLLKILNGEKFFNAVYSVYIRLGVIRVIGLV